MPRKLIQILATDNDEILALADDGTVWWWQRHLQIGILGKWTRWGDALPQDDIPAPPPEILTSVTDDGEVMVTMPSGRVTFTGFWPAMKFAWLAIRRGYKVKVEEQ